MSDDMNVWSCYRCVPPGAMDTMCWNCWDEHALAADDDAIDAFLARATALDTLGGNLCRLATLGAAEHRGHAAAVREVVAYLRAGGPKDPGGMRPATWAKYGRSTTACVADDIAARFGGEGKS